MRPAEVAGMPAGPILILSVEGIGYPGGDHAATPLESPSVKLIVGMRHRDARHQKQRRSDGNDDQLRQGKGAMANAIPAVYGIASGGPTFSLHPPIPGDPGNQHYPECGSEYRDRLVS